MASVWALRKSRSSAKVLANAPGVREAMVISAMQFLAELRFMEGLWGWSGGRKASALRQEGFADPQP